MELIAERVPSASIDLVKRVLDEFGDPAVDNPTGHEETDSINEAAMVQLTIHGRKAEQQPAGSTTRLTTTESTTARSLGPLRSMDTAPGPNRIRYSSLLFQTISRRSSERWPSGRTRRNGKSPTALGFRPRR